MRPAILALAGGLALGACAVAPPSGPTVMALPGQNKSFAEFQRDDVMCRQYASAQIGQGAEVASNAATNNAVAGTVLGAAAGAALGAIGGNPAAGAAIGGGGGLLVGSSAGANAAQMSGASLQQRFNIAYTQCMYAQGNSVQRPIASAAPVPVVPPSYAFAPYGFYSAYPWPVQSSVSVGFGFGGHHGRWGRSRGWARGRRWR